jgi:hypothetical protein
VIRTQDPCFPEINPGVAGPPLFLSAPSLGFTRFSLYSEAHTCWISCSHSPPLPAVFLSGLHPSQPYPHVTALPSDCHFTTCVSCSGLV